MKKFKFLIGVPIIGASVVPLISASTSNSGETSYNVSEFKEYFKRVIDNLDIPYQTMANSPYTAKVSLNITNRINDFKDELRTRLSGVFNKQDMINFLNFYNQMIEVKWAKICNDALYLKNISTLVSQGKWNNTYVEDLMLTKVDDESYYQRLITHIEGLKTEIDTLKGDKSEQRAKLAALEALVNTKDTEIQSLIISKEKLAREIETLKVANKEAITSLEAAKLNLKAFNDFLNALPIQQNTKPYDKAAYEAAINGAPIHVRNFVNTLRAKEALIRNNEGNINEEEIIKLIKESDILNYLDKDSFRNDNASGIIRELLEATKKTIKRIGIEVDNLNTLQKESDKLDKEYQNTLRKYQIMLGVSLGGFVLILVALSLLLYKETKTNKTKKETK